MTTERLYNAMSKWLVCFAALSLIACNEASTASRTSGNKISVQRVGDVPTENARYKLYFITGEKGWLASGKKLWRTTDSGQSWSLVFSGEGSWDILASIDQLEFIDSRTGWMVVSPGGLYKSEDGGITWKHQDPFDGAIYSVEFFKDGKRGWAAGVMLHPPPIEHADKVSREDSYAVIAHTTDGGETWSQQIIDDARMILDLYFTDENQGWALGAPGLFHLENKSNKWKEVDFYKGGCTNTLLLKTLNPKNVVYEPLAIFLNQHIGWLSFKNGYIAKTTDGGRTWCDLLDPRRVWPDPVGLTFFSELYFGDSMNGWGLGADGSLQETNDGGASWEKVDTNVRFEDMYFLDRENGWAIAREGLFRIVSWKGK